MPDGSIIITAQDNYSSAIKSMSQVTKSFSKDVSQMEATLHKLNANKTTLKLEANDALKALKDAQKQFTATGKEADGLKVQLAQANYDNVKRNLDLVTQGAKAAEKQMQNTGEAFRRAENRGGFSSGFKSIVGKLNTSGALELVGQVAQQGTNAFVSSAFGSEAGNVFSSALSTAISGAAIGQMLIPIPGVGAAIWSYTGYTDYVDKVSVDTSGNVYTCGREGVFKKIDHTGAQIWSVTTGVSSAVKDIGADESGNVYSGNADTTVRKLKQIYKIY